MFTTNNPVSLIATWLPVVFSMHTRISGGLSDTEEKAETVIPWGSPVAPLDVTTVMPLGKRERAARKSSGVTGMV
jgi:hypothetical protein